MVFREAIPADIPQMQLVRNTVTENRLSNPALIGPADYLEFISVRGKGWVCEIDGNIAGFAVADLKDDSIWALFVAPGFEKKGIGRALHHHMLDWYFNQSKNQVWLSTSPGTRAEAFYRRAGWRETGCYGKGEIKFEMTAGEWMALRDTGRIIPGASS